jgi:hypothetical protein
MKRLSIAIALGAAMAAMLWIVRDDAPAFAEPASTPSAAKEASAGGTPDAAAVARSRKTVKMLDDIYKQTVVLITDKYVHDEDDFAAGSAAVALFDHVTKAGWHDVRLIDVTGQPYDDENVAKDEFEREGVKRLKSGENYFDQVVTDNRGPRLRAITPVPVVLQKCVMCHEHYRDARSGEPIGAISYSVAIE